MPAGLWFTLVRFRDTPQHLTGVAQARTAQETLTLLQTWAGQYPAETTVVFDPDNRPLTRTQLEERATRGEPPSSQD